MANERQSQETLNYLPTLIQITCKNVSRNVSLLICNRNNWYFNINYNLQCNNSLILNNSHLKTVLLAVISNYMFDCLINAKKFPISKTFKNHFSFHCFRL